MSAGDTAAGAQHQNYIRPAGTQQEFIVAKILTDKELLDIVRRAVEDDEIEDLSAYLCFIGDLASVINDNFGGTRGAVTYDPHDGLGVCVAVHRDENVPEDGGVYARYDEEADF
jgi:hypothetical protein